MVLNTTAPTSGRSPTRRGPAALGKDRPAPGVYVIPYCAGPAQMKDPAFVRSSRTGRCAGDRAQERRAGDGQAARSVALFCFLVSFTTAYVARHTLTGRHRRLLVLRITGTVAFAGYATATSRTRSGTGCVGERAAGLLDALVYAVLTGLVFRFLGRWGSRGGGPIAPARR